MLTKFLLKFLLIISLSSFKIIFPKYLDPFKAAQEAIKENLKAPTAYADGRVPTLNHMGAMSPSISPLIEKFIDIAKMPGAKVLDIGAAYGLPCIKALQAGATDYTANDLDIRHLKILARNLFETNPLLLAKIKLLFGSFPHEITLEENRYDAILLARVLHFFTPHDLVIALDALLKALKPGGFVFAIVLTPYVRGFAPFIVEFERRVAAGEEFPGFVEDKTKFVDTTIVPAHIIASMSKPFLFFDEKTARHCFEKAGFLVTSCVTTPLCYPSPIWQLDGRENVSIIAQKPK